MPNVTFEILLARIEAGTITATEIQQIPLTSITAQERLALLIALSGEYLNSGSAILTDLEYPPLDEDAPPLLKTTGHFARYDGVLYHNAGDDESPMWEILLTSTGAAAKIATEVTKMRHITSPLWRLVRRATSLTGPSVIDASKFRTLVLGDSLAVTPDVELAKHLGVGGSALGVTSNQYPPSVGSDSYLGVEVHAHQITATLSGQWTRVPNGAVRQLNAAASNRLHFELRVPCYSVYVCYLANTGYGKLKVQYRVGKTGAFTDATGDWFIKSGANSGTNEGTGILNTANASTEKYSIACIQIPAGMNFYDIRVVPTVGDVYISDVWFNNGGLLTGLNTNIENSRTGSLLVNHAVGGEQIANQKNVPLSVWQTLAAVLDPHIITFRADETHSDVTYLETHWPAYANNIRDAFPRAVFFVFGSSITGAMPTRDNANALAADNYLRAWCEENDQVFVDIRQFMPEYVSDGGMDDLWPNDGLHTDNAWFHAILLDILRPVFDIWGCFSQIGGGKNYLRPARGSFNSIDLFDRGKPLPDNAFDRTLLLNMAPGYGAELLFMPESGHNFLGTQAIGNGIGFGATSSSAALPNSLYFRQSNFTVTYVSRGSSNGGGVWGLGLVVDATLTDIGWTFIAPRTGRVALNACSLTGTAGTSSIANFYRQAAQNGSSPGNLLWSWRDNGTLVFQGQTINAFTTTFSYEEPAAAVTLHTPVCATAGSGGAHTRVIGVVPSYATTAAAEAAVGVGEVYYDEATKKIKTRLV